MDRRYHWGAFVLAHERWAVLCNISNHGKDLWKQSDSSSVWTCPTHLCSLAFCEQTEQYVCSRKWNYFSLLFIPSITSPYCQVLVYAMFSTVQTAVYAFIILTVLKLSLQRSEAKVWPILILTINTWWKMCHSKWFLVQYLDRYEKLIMSINMVLLVQEQLKPQDKWTSVEMRRIKEVVLLL